MEFLIWLIVLVVVVAIAYAILQWSGIALDPIVVRVASILLVGIILVVLIRFLWPFLMGGPLPGLR